VPSVEFPDAPADARLLVAFVEARAKKRPLRAVAGADPLLDALARATAAREAGDSAAAASALASARRLPGGELPPARRGEVEALADGQATGGGLERYRELVPALDGRAGAAGAATVPLGPIAPRGLPPARPGCRRDDAGFLAIRRAVAVDLGRAV